MAILGLRGTQNLASNERPESWREGIIHFFPNGETPLMALGSMAKSENVGDYTFNWWDKSLPTRRLFLSAAANSTTTSLSVDDGSGGSAAKNCKAGTVLINERTTEHVIVESDPTDDSVKVTRARGTTSAAAMNDNDGLQIIGSAYEDGSSAQVSAVAYDPTQRTNYTQIFMDSSNLSRRTLKTVLRTGDKGMETRRETLQIHAIGLEWSALLGEKLEEASSGNSSATRRTTSGGFQSWVTTNVHDANGNLSYFELMDFLEEDFRYGSQEKLLLAGSTAVNALNKLAKLEMTMNSVPGDQSFGINMKEIISPFGVILLKMHPLLSDSAKYRGYGFLVDMPHFVIRTFDDTTLIENTQENFVIQKHDVFYSDIGWEWQIEKSHALWKGITGAA
jgi:hypothetical protein